MNKFVSKVRYKSLRRLFYVLVVVSLIAMVSIAVQLVSGDHADAFANKRSVETISSNIAVSSDETIDDTLPHSTSKQSFEKPTLLAQNWQSWNGDSTWFSQNFCSSGPQSYCRTNVTWASAGKGRSSSKLKITGMAAGFDTQARIVIRRRGCNGFIPGTSCDWRTSVDEILQPRTFKTWTYTDSVSRIARIDPVSGEARVHLAVATSDSPSSGSGQFPQSFNFCVATSFNDGSGRLTSTRSVWANNYDEAEQKLYQELGYAGAGISQDVRRGAC